MREFFRRKNQDNHAENNDGEVIAEPSNGERLKMNVLDCIRLNEMNLKWLTDLKFRRREGEKKVEMDGDEGQLKNLNNERK